MTHAQIAEWFVGVVLLVTGLSHAAHPRSWSGLFVDLLERPYGGLVIGLLTLLVAAPLVAAHNDWSWGPGLVATVVAWAWAAKGTLYLLAPGLPRRIARRRVERAAIFRVAGAVLVVLGAVVLAGLLLPGRAAPA